MGEAFAHLPSLLAQSTGIPVDGVDHAVGTQQVRERQGKRSRAGAQVRPGGAGAVDAVPEQSDVIAVLHGRKYRPANSR
jgi:hypothetical protein